jgi:hypothetical protein
MWAALDGAARKVLRCPTGKKRHMQVKAPVRKYSD